MIRARLHQASQVLVLPLTLLIASLFQYQFDLLHQRRDMFKLRLIFIASVIILAGLFIAVVCLVPSSQTSQESRRTQLIKGDNEWILQCDIANDSEEDVKYTFNLRLDDTLYTDSAAVKPGKTYTYIHHIYPHQLMAGKVTFMVYQEGIAEPLEQADYYIRND